MISVVGRRSVCKTISKRFFLSNDFVNQQTRFMESGRDAFMCHKNTQRSTCRHNCNYFFGWSWNHRAFMKTNGLAINKLVERRKTKQNCYKDLWSLSKSRVVLYTRPNRSHHNVHVQLHAQMHICQLVPQFPVTFFHENALLCMMVILWEEVTQLWKTKN